MAAVSRTLTWCIAAALIVTCALAVRAQGGSDGTDAGSFGAVIAEIHQLRLAVEESTRNQTQIQALGVYLSVQQARLVQVATRVDSAPKELDALTVRSSEIADRLANLEKGPETVDPGERQQWAKALGQQTRALKLEQESVALQQQQARSREAELSQMLQVEDARWADLIFRLVQLTKR